MYIFSDVTPQYKVKSAPDSLSPFMCILTTIHPYLQDENIFRGYSRKASPYNST